MSVQVKQAQIKPSAMRASSALELLRRHPLWGYFILAFGLQWLWEVPLFASQRQWSAGPWLLLCPTSAAFSMAWIVEGKAGIVGLLRRWVLWHINIRWYAMAILFIPVMYFIGLALIPGAIPALQIPNTGLLVSYLVDFVLVFFIGASLSEELGWRGFALPRLQQGYGPLYGTLILGFLWGIWHLPLWLFLPGHAGAGTGLLGIGVPMIEWLAFIMGFAFIITWVQNHSRGSFLPAMLFHASINSTYDNLPSAFFPTLFPPEVAAHASNPFFFEVGIVLVAVLIIVATRGRLGYDAYRGKTVSRATGSAVKQGEVPAS